MIRFYEVKILMNFRNVLRRWQTFLSSCCAGAVALFAVSTAHAQTSTPPTCARTVKADVVALNQALIYVFSRLINL